MSKSVNKIGAICRLYRLAVCYFCVWLFACTESCCSFVVMARFSHTDKQIATPCECNAMHEARIQSQRKTPNQLRFGLKMNVDTRLLWRCIYDDADSKRCTCIANNSVATKRKIVKKQQRRVYSRCTCNKHTQCVLHASHIGWLAGWLVRRSIVQ